MIGFRTLYAAIYARSRNSLCMCVCLFRSGARPRAYKQIIPILVIYVKIDFLVYVYQTTYQNPAAKPTATMSDGGGAGRGIELNFKVRKFQFNNICETCRKVSRRSQNIVFHIDPCRTISYIQRARTFFDIRVYV